MVLEPNSKIAILIFLDTNKSVCGGQGNNLDHTDDDIKTTMVTKVEEEALEALAEKKELEAKTAQQ